VDGKVRVTETNSRRSYRQAPDAAARVTDFYRAESPDDVPSGLPPLVFETMLGEVEERAKSAIDHLLTGGPLAVDEHVALIHFMALQVTRGRAFRAGISSITTNTFKIVNPASVEHATARVADALPDGSDADVSELLAFLTDLHQGEVELEPQRLEMLVQSAALAHHVGQFMIFRDWQVYFAPLGDLITSDEPVVIIEGVDADRRKAGGMGTADVVLFPLAPSAVLAMFHPDVERHPMTYFDELSVREVDELNREIAANSHYWMFERADRRTTLVVPLPPRQPASVTEGPFRLVEGDREGELIVETKPSRWYRAPSLPPLPVERWWWSAPHPGAFLRSEAMDALRGPSA